MTTETLTRTPAVTLADVEAIAKDEPAWLREKRLEAWHLYEAMDFPDVYDEEWRRTDVRAVPAEGLGRADVRTELSSPRTDGVIVTSLESALREHEGLVRDRLYSAVTTGEWKYLTLNAALWDEGIFVYVPNEVEVSVSLQLSQALDEAGTAFPRTLIVAGRNSRVSIVDESSSHGAERSLVSGAVEIFVGDGAKVEYYSVNRWGENVYNFNTVRAVLGRDAEFVGTAAGIGSKLTKMRFDVEMPQPGARTELLGVTFGNGDQHFDYNTLQNHTGNHTTSDLQFKSALTDSASLVWYGITRINETAGGSEANQTSRNLLLSEHAKAAPIPILEIKAHDVSKCSHGATAGPVEESELFYLESRAIPRATAEQMLVQGYFADVVDRIPNVQVRERVMDAVLAKMGGRIESLSYDQLMSA
jgi:Fe-S cluster assembly protein SufD